MDKKLEKFLYNLKEENPRDYFLIMKFYYKPSSILSFNKKDIDDEIYYNKDAAINYIMNNNFLMFLKLYLPNNEMKYDSLECLHLLLTEADEMAYTIMYNNFSNSDIYNYIKIYIKNKNFIKRAKSYDFDLADWVLRKLESIIVNNIYRDNILNNLNNIDIEDEKFVLNRIDKGEYNINALLTCDNRFLDVIEDRLLNEDLDENTINAIIDIFSDSIFFKKRGYSHKYEYIEKNLLSNFDINRAAKLKLKLENKRKKERKVIYLKSHK